MAKKASKLKISAERAQDWISSVLNPIIEGVRREVSLLGKPLHWLPETRDFEYLHPIASYIADIYFDNFEDFLEKHPKFRPGFQRHDDVLNELREAVTGGYDQLAGDRMFRAGLAAATLGDDLTDLDHRYFMAFIAGGHPELPPVFSKHDVYNRLSSDLRDPRQLHNIKGQRVSVSRSLEDIDRDIHDRLVKLRTEIADQYGARIQPVE
jgi:hypothetical protein